MCSFAWARHALRETSLSGCGTCLARVGAAFCNNGAFCGGFRYFVELAVWQVGGGAAPLTGPKMRREACVSKAVSANAGLCDADVAGLPCCARRVFAALVTATVDLAKQTEKRPICRHGNSEVM